MTVMTVDPTNNDSNDSIMTVDPTSNDSNDTRPYN